MSNKHCSCIARALYTQLTRQRKKRWLFCNCEFYSFWRLLCVFGQNKTLHGHIKSEVTKCDLKQVKNNLLRKVNQLLVHKNNYTPKGRKVLLFFWRINYTLSRHVLLRKCFRAEPCVSDFKYTRLDQVRVYSKENEWTNMDHVEPPPQFCPDVHATSSHPPSFQYENYI